MWFIEMGRKRHIVKGKGGGVPLQSPLTVYRFSVEKAQTVVEYLLLLGVVTAVVLVAFNVYLPRSQQQTNIFFNEVVINIMDDAPRARSYSDASRYP